MLPIFCSVKSAVKKEVFSQLIASPERDSKFFEKFQHILDRVEGTVNEDENVINKRKDNLGQKRLQSGDQKVGDNFVERVAAEDRSKICYLRRHWLLWHKSVDGRVCGSWHESRREEVGDFKEGVLSNRTPRSFEEATF